MTPIQRAVLNVVYGLEESLLRENRFDDAWVTPAEVLTQLPPEINDATAVRQTLRELWVMRKLLQVCFDQSRVAQLVDVRLDAPDAFGTEDRLAVEQNDVRGAPGSAFQQVAIYPDDADVRYRSRTAEIARLLARNYQRFNMAPSTGLIRYDRRPQYRPMYDRPIAELAVTLTDHISQGRLPIEDALGQERFYPLDLQVDRAVLSQSVQAVLHALAGLLQQRGRAPNLAAFQVRSIVATLAGVHCRAYRNVNAAHVVTAGVGSGKSYAFQIGALVHVAYQALKRIQRLQVLLLYPRVLLAANQFQDLRELINAVNRQLGIQIRPPVLDAGQQLVPQMNVDRNQGGALLTAIQFAYQGNYQILISNLDTLANRLSHPEASEGLTSALDLLVFDEVHLLSGIYGGHAKMLLKRVELLRKAWRGRRSSPQAYFEATLQVHDPMPRPYFVAASATVAEPRKHTSRIFSLREHEILYIEHGEPQETGWVHHLFLRQRPQVSNTSAVVNATSCLIHNRRDGVFREYYQRADGQPISLEDLNNPVQPSPTVAPRPTSVLHKTLGFCDALDSVGRWADLAADNEQTKMSSMSQQANPAQLSLPYFVRFQEPLWRILHYSSFAQNAPVWLDILRQHYGGICRDCKKGIRRRERRFPPNLTATQVQTIQRLWDPAPPVAGTLAYIRELGVDRALHGSPWLGPMTEASQSEFIENLDRCPFHRCGFCWWWSRDDLGSNRPTPPTDATPLSGFKKPSAANANRYHAVNAVRLRTFTSSTDFNSIEVPDVNDLFRGDGERILRGRPFRPVQENASLVIGSPRIEVGIDMDRAMDGITFRAMRDPASVQQKAGRVGRESGADALIVHLVTNSLREQFYCRNPQIVLDPYYLQPIPLHDSNLIVQRNHYFMAVVDFLTLQALGPAQARIANNANRLMLINDQGLPGSFTTWAAKVRGVYDFLFGGHPRAAQNLANLMNYLAAIGATPDEIMDPQAPQAQPGYPLPTDQVGAIDVFQHDFGPGLLLHPLYVNNQLLALADVCQYPEHQGGLNANTANLPRHQQFLTDYRESDAPIRDRSYLWQILGLGVFRRGVPQSNISGNQPYLWVPSLFEAVGNESVVVAVPTAENRNLSKYETVSLACALLCPGTYTYRYSNDGWPMKVPIASRGAAGPRTLMPLLEAVRLNIGAPEYFEPAGCEPIGAADLPDDFAATGQALAVYRPKQIRLIRAASNPRPVVRGLLADDDEVPANDATPSILPRLPTTPQCYSLKWYRLALGAPEDIPCRFRANYRGPNQQVLPRLPWPAVTRLFHQVRYDPSLAITEFVWGLDRTFATRAESARLVYRDADNVFGQAVALGQHFTAPGLEFQIDFAPQSHLTQCLLDVWNNINSAVHQSLLWQSVHAFFASHARSNPDPNAPPMIPGALPSIFVVLNLVKVVALHLMLRWHPASGSGQTPAQPFSATLVEIAGCLTVGHANYIDQNRFLELCDILVRHENPANPQMRLQVLAEQWQNLSNASASAGVFDQAFWLRTARRIFLNTLGISLHTAGLLLSGAEDHDLGYFYKEHSDESATVYLFDTDQFGNGTSHLIREHFYISPVERTLANRLAALGGVVDPLPTTDFATCLEESLQECDQAHAGHLAFHAVNAPAAPFADLSAAVAGERQTAGSVYDFIRQVMGLNSYDDLIAFAICPEFLAHITSPGAGYVAYNGQQLVGSPAYPTFQWLEDALGGCVYGCPACVVAPEQNVHGPLAAKASVNKLLLDAMYMQVCCQGTLPPQQVDPLTRVTYPAQDVGRTCLWANAVFEVAAANATPLPGYGPMQVRLVEADGPHQAVDVQVVVAATPGPFARVMRTGLGRLGGPAPRVRLRMML